MAMTDPIADMITRIRNANKERHESLECPCSKQKVEILKVLEREGFISGFSVKELDNNKKSITVKLKYKGNRRVINGIKRISKPGLRIYVESDKIPYVYNGLGTAIITTSKGLMTDREARKEHVGGEVIAYVW